MLTNEYTQLLLHLEGPDGSRAAADYHDHSPHFGDGLAFNISGAGSVGLDTAQAKFGASSFWGDTTGTGGIRIEDQSGEGRFDFGTNDLTIDLWTRMSALDGSNARYFWYQNDAGAGHRFSLRLDTNGTGVVIVVIESSVTTVNATINFASAISTDTWHHLAFVRNGNTIYVYKDGVLEGSTGFNVTLHPGGSNYVFIGGQGSAGIFINTWIDEIRVQNGEAYWTDEFTPPDAPYVNSFERAGRGKYGIGEYYTRACREDSGWMEYYSRELRAISGWRGAFIRACRALLGYAENYSRAGRGGYGHSTNYPRAHRGAHRIADDSLDRWEIYKGEDGEEPDFDSAPWATFTVADLPFSTPELDAPGVYRIVRRKRNAWGLLSQNVESIRLEIDAEGNVVQPNPSAPVNLTVNPAANGAVLIRAQYRRALDGDYAATQWLIYLTTDGSSPDPETDDPIVVEMNSAGGLDYLRHTSDEFSDGLTVKVLLRARRVIDAEEEEYADSESTDIVSAITDTDGPAEPEPGGAFHNQNLMTEAL